ncbi:MAG: LacI family DNA-binding transcriptional regulator [Opitutales bacterium]|nr:LacI family DNA-binding transcriptional regulator [Opitutales bacterium]
MASRTKKRITQTEIAKELGVSKSTVSLAFVSSKKVSEELRKKILDFAKKRGYKKNPLLSSAMSSIKKSRSDFDFLETIVLINANQTKDAPEKYPIFSRYINGVNIEAKELGYGVYYVWLYEKNLTPDRLKKILYSRGIRGGVVVGHINNKKLPEEYSEIWNNFKFVAAGTKTFNPTIDFISSDKFLIAQHITNKIIKMGYKRPSMIIDEHFDEIVEGRTIGGFLRAQLNLSDNNRVPPFLKVRQAKKNPKLLSAWLEKYKPDAVMCTSNSTSEWMALPEISEMIAKYAVQLNMELKSDEHDWSAIDQNYELVGRFAVRKLFEILNATASSSLKNVVTATIVEPRWNKKLSLS